MAEAQQSGQTDMSDVQIIFSPTTTEKSTPLDLDELARDFQTNTDWNIPEAYMALILSAAFADGELAPDSVGNSVIRSSIRPNSQRSMRSSTNASSPVRTASRKPAIRYPAICVFQSLRTVWTLSWPTVNSASRRRIS